MDLSERTKNYCAALLRDGDNFNPRKWYQKVEAEKAKKMGLSADVSSVTSAEGLNSPQALPDTCVHPRSASSNRPAPRPVLQEKSRSRSLEGEIRDDLAELRVAWRDLQKSRKRTAIYAFLKRVFFIVRSHRFGGSSQKFVRAAQSAVGLHPSAAAEPFAAAIRAASKGKLDRREISRYSRVLRFADENMGEHQSFKKFIVRNGGLNRCAAAYAALRIRK